MNFNVKEIIILGWPVLSILFICSITALAVVLQCWIMTGRVQDILKVGAAQAEKRTIYDNLRLVEVRLALLGTIANAAPFIGLLGTVIGIIRSFHMISSATGGGLSTIAGGISEALVSTAAGLAVAIPSSMLYNYFTFHHQRLSKDAGVE